MEILDTTRKSDESGKTYYNELYTMLHSENYSNFHHNQDAGKVHTYPYSNRIGNDCVYLTCDLLICYSLNSYEMHWFVRIMYHYPAVMHTHKKRILCRKNKL